MDKAQVDPECGVVEVAKQVAKPKKAPLDNMAQFKGGQWFRLVRNDDTINLVACDENGIINRCGHILGIRENGCLELYSGITGVNGLKLDARNRITLNAE